jgi:hypothetical protein
VSESVSQNAMICVVCGHVKNNDATFFGRKEFHYRVGNAWVCDVPVVWKTAAAAALSQPAAAAAAAAAAAGNQKKRRLRANNSKCVLWCCRPRGVANGWSVENIMRTRQLKIFRVPPDGDCCFHAVIKLLHLYLDTNTNWGNYGLPCLGDTSWALICRDNHELFNNQSEVAFSMRTRLCQYMNEQHETGTDNSMWLQGTDDFTQHMAGLSLKGRFADMIDVKFLSALCKVSITVITVYTAESSNGVNGLTSEERFVYEGDDRYLSQTLFLLLRGGDDLGGHFDALVPVVIPV